MKRSPPRVRPGSRTQGRALADLSDFRDLIKRHEAVSSLVKQALADIAATERAIATAKPPLARKLEMELANRRRFLALLESRLAALATEFGEHEQQQMQLLARLAAPPGTSKR